MTESGIAAFARIAIAAPGPGAGDGASPVAHVDGPAPSQHINRERRRTGSIEVRVTNGRSLKADESIIAPDVLKRLVTALDGDGT